MQVETKPVRIDDIVMPLVEDTVIEAPAWESIPAVEKSFDVLADTGDLRIT